MSNYSHRKYFTFLFIFIFIFLGAANLEAYYVEPPWVNLTWEDNAWENMTVNWITPYEPDQMEFLYAKDGLDKLEDFEKVEPEVYTFEETDTWISSVSLQGLKPDKEYSAVINKNGNRVEEFQFKTMPETGEEVSFVAGGDSRTNRQTRRFINKQAAEFEPDFVAFAGDLIENPLDEEEWKNWMQDWHELMITDDDRRIPIVPAIGNHEVSGGYLQDRESAPYYYNYFNLPGNEEYYALEITEDVVMITLDSAHTNTIYGEQKKWLEKTLEEYQDRELKFVQHHIPAWPTSRPFTYEYSVKIREHWVPLYEEYDVDVVFEAHDHTYKISEFLYTKELRDDFHNEIESAMETARQEFDPEADYSPLEDMETMQIEQGMWQEAGFEDPGEAMSYLAEGYALYYKQENDLDADKIINRIIDTQFYHIYWNLKLEKLGFENLIDEEDGVLYLGDGGWGAPLRDPVDVDDTWWLSESSRDYNFFQVAFDGGSREMRIEPKIIKLEEQDLITIYGQDS